MYFNTTGETGQKLAQFASTAKNQDQVIEHIFEQFGYLTASKCHAIYVKVTKRAHTPLTSIRRGIATLRDDKVIKSTGKKEPSIFNRPETIWQYAG